MISKKKRQKNLVYRKKESQNVLRTSRRFGLSTESSEGSNCQCSKEDKTTYSRGSTKGATGSHAC